MAAEIDEIPGDYGIVWYEGDDNGYEGLFLREDAVPWDRIQELREEARALIESEGLTEFRHSRVFDHE
ncbi:unnamed protein product, partial [Prorocentrum cordatum]